MSSRFFQHLTSDDSDDSDSDSSQEQRIAPTKLKEQISDDDSDSSDREQKKKLSGADKTVNELLESCKIITSSAESQDWVLCLSEFDKLLKQNPKYLKYFEKTKKVPSAYIKCLSLTEDASKEALNDKVALKKMNASQAKAVNALNQKFRKHNVSYAEKIAAFKENGVESDDSLFGNESSSESSSSSESDRDKLTGRNKWLKRPEKSEKDKTAFTDEVKKRTKAVKEKSVNFKEVKEAIIIDFSVDSLYKRLGQVLEARGKKSTDKHSLIATLRQLNTISSNPYQKTRVLLTLIPAQFDLSTSSTYLNENIWKDIIKDISDLLNIVESNPLILIKEIVHTVEDDIENEKKIIAGQSVELLGNIGSYIDRLDQEFIKSLQHIDPFSAEYIERIKRETELYALIVRAQKYFTEIQHNDSLFLIILCRLEHIYFKPNKIINAIESIVKSANPDISSLLCLDSGIDILCSQLYKAPYERIRTRAILCHIYHYSLLDRFSEAKDMLLASHLQDTIIHADIQTQILFNRTTVQLGLCAFRTGDIKSTNQCLSEIYGSGKTRELLAQGLSSQKQEKTIEQEKAERVRQVPYHMHINLELLECVYLVSCMIMEIPNMALNYYDTKKKTISKTFRRFLEYHERQAFVGPPENPKDFIMAACKSMILGDWEKAVKYALTLKVWDNFANSGSIKAMISSKIKEESLHTHIIMNACNYDTISFDHLSNMFSLDNSIVSTIVSKAIYHEEINAYIEDDHVTFSEHPPSRLEYLTHLYAEKVSLLIEVNEKMADSISGEGEKVESLRKPVYNRFSKKRF